MTTITIDGAQALLKGHPRIAGVEIEGARCRLTPFGALEYQPKHGALVKFTAWGWDRWNEAKEFIADIWAPDLAAAQDTASTFNCKVHSVEIWFQQEPIGWTPLQIGKATVWASDKIDYTSQIALKYGAAAQ